MRGIIEAQGFAAKVSKIQVVLQVGQNITVDAVLEVGFDDKGILQITLIASWFNYINRVADALGVGRDDIA